MMKTTTVGGRHCIALGLLFAVVSLAHAALPPYAERVREIQAVLDDVAVFHLMEFNEVDSIVWRDNNHYRVQWKDSEYFYAHEQKQTRTCSIVVEIVDDPWGPNEPPSGRKFHVAVDGKLVTCEVKKP